MSTRILELAVGMTETRERLRGTARIGMAARALVGGLVVLATLCVKADPGFAGTYVLRACNVPGQSRAPVAPWRWATLANNTYANDECASGGGFGINAGPMDPGTGASIAFDRPGYGPRAPISIRRVRLWLIARLSGAGSDMFVNWSAGGPTGTTATAGIFSPPGGDTLTSPYETPLLAEDTRSFTLIFSCSATASTGCTPSNPEPLEVRGAEVTLEEDVPPAVSITGGTLLSEGVQAGVRGLNFSGFDGESGIAQVSAVLGTTVVAAQDSGEECSYAGVTACPPNREGVLAVDTRKVPNGSYPLTLRVTDAAGNRESFLLPSAVQVANSNPLMPNGNGASGDARLTASFVKRRGRETTVSFGRRVALKGRLVTAAGSPISGARIEIAEIPTLKGLPGTKGTAMTAADGTFRYGLRARGVSRAVRVEYRPSLEGTDIAAYERLRLDVAAAATLRVSLRGIRVSYAGRVLSGPAPRGGTRVHVQGRARGGAWTTFAMKRTDRSGRFAGSYRLRIRRPGVQLQFRVRVPKQHGYPYARGTGPVVTRTVR